MILTLYIDTFNIVIENKKRTLSLPSTIPYLKKELFDMVTFFNSVIFIDVRTTDDIKNHIKMNNQNWCETNIEITDMTKLLLFASKTIKLIHMLGSSFAEMHIERFELKTSIGDILSISYKEMLKLYADFLEFEWEILPSANVRSMFIDLDKIVG